VFTDRKRRCKRRGREKLEVKHLKGPARIVGWVDAATFLEKGALRKKGTPIRNDRGGINFTTRRDEWNIKIQHLHEMDGLLAGSHDELIPWR
jgi:hypothetical protein